MIKKVLIIDDSDLKRDRIENYIREINSAFEINKFSFGRELQWFLKNYYKNQSELQDTILFLDWNFPYYQNDWLEQGAGKHILFIIKHYELPIQVVIVSSDDVDIDKEEYPFVLGTIKDNSSIYQQPLYEKVLKGETLWNIN